MPRRRLDPPDDVVLSQDHFAARVRRARQAMGLSTRALAAAAGVSQSLISQIERGECEPSLSTLRSIATALEVKPHDLLGNRGVSRIEITRRADTQAAFSDSPENVSGRRLINQPDALLEAYQLTISEVGQDNWFQHPGDEIVLVHTGSLEVHFEGQETVAIAEGDSLYYPGDLPHMWRHVGTKPTMVTHIVSSGSHRFELDSADDQ